MFLYNFFIYIKSLKTYQLNIIKKTKKEKKSDKKNLSEGEKQKLFKCRKKIL